MAGFVGTGRQGARIAPNTQRVQKPLITPLRPAQPSMGVNRPTGVMGPPAPPGTPPAQPTYTAQPYDNTTILGPLSQYLGLNGAVDAARGGLANTNAQKQLALLNLGTQQGTNAINQNAGFGREQLQLNTNSNTQQQDYLRQLQGFSNTGYSNALADLMANMGFGDRSNLLTQEGFGLAQGAINTNRGFADQSNAIQQGFLINAEESLGLQEAGLAQNRDITQRNSAINEKVQAGSEAARGSISSGGYGERLGQLRQQLTDQMTDYDRQQAQLGINRENIGGARAQQTLGYNQQLANLDQAQSQLGLSRSGNSLQEEMRRFSQGTQERDLGLSRTQADAQLNEQRQNLSRAAKGLNIDSRRLEAGVTQALDQLGLSNQIGTAAIYQGLADQAENGFSQLAPILNLVQQIMGWSSQTPGNQTSANDTDSISRFGGNKTWGGYTNGQIPKNAMVDIGGGKMLAPQAATDFQRMVADAAAVGVDIGVTDAYRDLAGQMSVRARKGDKVQTAKPGTSKHGEATALDIKVTPQVKAWLDKNAARYGFSNPSWAQKKGKSYEPWHWEYKGK